MSVNVVKARRDQELLQKGKYFNPFQLENEKEIKGMKKQEASQEEKDLRDRFLKSMKYDIDVINKKKEDEVISNLI
jgi:hypothetical protein